MTSIFIEAIVAVGSLLKLSFYSFAQFLTSNGLSQFNIILSTKRMYGYTNLYLIIF